MNTILISLLLAVGVTPPSAIPIVGQDGGYPVKVIGTFSAPAVTNVQGLDGGYPTKVDQGAPSATPWLVTDSHSPASSPLACRLSDGTSFLSALAVTGTFWQATQPVSIGSSVSVFMDTQLPTSLDGSGYLKIHEQGTVPVTGTFWQATQPVSIATMPSTPVTGTFWQATQPVTTSDTTTSGTLGTVGDVVSISVNGLGGALLYIPSSSTLVGTVIPEYSPDNGTTWITGIFSSPTSPDKTTSVPTVSGTAYARNILVPGGASNVRVRLLARTGGSATATLRVTVGRLTDPVLSIGTPNSDPPLALQAVGGSDGVGLRLLKTDSSGNVQTHETGTVPVTGTFWQSTQPISGTVTTNAGTSTKATYTVFTAGLADTVNADVFTIEAGTSKTVRIRQIVILNPGAQTTAGIRTFGLFRRTTASTNGVITPQPMDTTTAAYTGICRSAPTARGTAGVQLLSIPILTPTTVGSFTPIVVDFDKGGVAQVPTIQPGTANALALVDNGAAGATGLYAYIVFTEE